MLSCRYGDNYVVVNDSGLFHKTPINLVIQQGSRLKQWGGNSATQVQYFPHWCRQVGQCEIVIFFCFRFRSRCRRSARWTTRWRWACLMPLWWSTRSSRSPVSHNLPDVGVEWKSVFEDEWRFSLISVLKLPLVAVWDSQPSSPPPPCVTVWKMTEVIVSEFQYLVSFSVHPVAALSVGSRRGCEPSSWMVSPMCLL